MYTTSQACFWISSEKLSTALQSGICCSSILSLVQFLFSFVSYSLSYIYKKKNKRKYKLNQGLNWTSTYTPLYYPHFTTCKYLLVGCIHFPYNVSFTVHTRKSVSSGYPNIKKLTDLCPSPKINWKQSQSFRINNTLSTDTIINRGELAQVEGPPLTQGNFFQVNCIWENVGLLNESELSHSYSIPLIKYS